MEKQYEVVVYVYRVVGKRDFWLYDGVFYWRFALVGDHFRVVRRQPFLPAQAVGFCAGVTRAEQRQLVREANRQKIRFSFYESAAECEKQAGLDQHNQFFFDRTPPAGIISMDGIHFTSGFEHQSGDAA